MLLHAGSREVYAGGGRGEWVENQNVVVLKDELLVLRYI